MRLGDLTIGAGGKRRSARNTIEDDMGFLQNTVGAAAIAASLTAGFPATASAVEVERVVSPGGIEAWLVSEPAVPLVALDFAFRGGSAQDEDGKEGTANLLSTLLDEGAGELDSEAFQTRLEETAVRLSFNAGRDSFSGEMRTLTRNLEDAIELTRLALTEPRFDEEAVQRMRQAVSAGVRSRQNDPQTIASKTWFETAYPEHPYGRPVNGSLETIGTITADDLRGYKDRVMTRDNLIVAAVGDIEAEALGQLLDAVFGDLPETGELKPVADVEPTALGRQIVVDLDVPQATIMAGTEGLARDDEDFIPAYVVNHILGAGSFSSRFFREIREKRGLAYGAYSQMAPLDHSALFFAGTATQNARAKESLDIIRAEIARMAEEGPTEAELEKAKSYLVGAYALRFDTSGKIASQLVALQMDDLGIDYFTRRNDLVRAVTIEDVRRAARRMLEDPLLTVVVGRPDGLASSEG